MAEDFPVLVFLKAILASQEAVTEVSGEIQKVFSEINFRLDATKEIALDKWVFV